MEPMDATEASPPARGEVRFVDGASLPPLRSAASAAGLLYAEVASPGPAVRGQLGEFLEAAVEESLSHQSAPPPGVGATSDWALSLSDQTRRALAAGLRGVVLAVGALDAIAGPQGVLDPDDSASLRAWAAASRELPVTLLLDRRNAGLSGFAAPLPLDELLGALPCPAPRARPLPAQPDQAAEPPPPTVVVAAPAAVTEGEGEVLPPAIDPSDWRMFAEELHAARGPKPLPVVERMFATRYLPLAEAETQGLADSFGKQVRAEWASSFAKSYGEAFKALGVTGKRPPMVFDVPQLSARIARLHGARAVELFLVDGMRFDLGARVQQRLRRALGGRAACAEQMLLWSALPTTTATQLDLLAHGAEALSRPLPADEDESASIARGRSVSTPRRVKIGQRDVLKLDLVEARLRENGPPLAERLDSIAAEIAGAVARHAEGLPDRTLLVVFGDHGFALDAMASGSGPARYGGASPEEVLVPGFAWLLGGVH